METVTILLKSGASIHGHYDGEDDFDEIYAIWESGKGIMGFDNCAIRAEEVAALTWK